eukprot:365727-Chlamydomonas_euryale.AAC.3
MHEAAVLPADRSVQLADGRSHVWVRMHACLGACVHVVRDGSNCEKSLRMPYQRWYGSGKDYWPSQLSPTCAYMMTTRKGWSFVEEGCSRAARKGWTRGCAFRHSPSWRAWRASDAAALTPAKARMTSYRRLQQPQHAWQATGGCNIPSTHDKLPAAATAKACMAAAAAAVTGGVSPT